MKKIILAVITLSIISCAKEEKPVDYAILTGTIENIDGGKFSLRNSEKVISEIEVGETGTFTDTVKQIESGYFTFKYANETSQVYLKPGYNLTLKLNAKEFDESITYEGLGAVENNYLAQKFLREEALGQLNSYQYLGSLEEADYVHKMDSISALQSAFLGEQKDLDTDFITLEEAGIKYNLVNKLNLFEAYKKYVTKDENFKKSDAFPDFESGLNADDENLLAVNSYKNYLNSHYSKKADNLAKSDSMEVDLAFLKIVSSEVKSPKIKEHLLYNSAKYGITYTNELQAYYDVFMANATDEAHKNEITEKYNKLIKLSKGEPSPTFVNYENFNGGTTSLEDLKGKYVYVDVWATWCGPCKAEIPSLKKVEKDYHDKNIAFVSMSVDKKNDYDKWRKMVEDENLGGIQLFAPEDWNSDFVTNYSILGIPRFILIDPAGNIVNSNAPRPSSEDLITLFNALEI